MYATCNALAGTQRRFLVYRAVHVLCMEIGIKVLGRRYHFSSGYVYCNDAGIHIHQRIFVFD
jgi:hypothetical protein